MPSQGAEKPGHQTESAPGFPVAQLLEEGKKARRSGLLTGGGQSGEVTGMPQHRLSMSALQGQTVMQWPQETQLDSPIGVPPSIARLGRTNHFWPIHFWRLRVDAV
jgi:hypothetical protein